MTTVGPGDRKSSTYNLMLRQLSAGGSHNNGSFTLRANQTTTTVAHESANPASHISWTPLTAHALTAQQAGMYVSARTTGSFTITHASSANTDQNFTFTCTGR